MSIQKLFKPYIVTRKNGQCQVLIPLVELDELCKKIEEWNMEIRCEHCNGAKWKSLNKDVYQCLLCGLKIKIMPIMADSLMCKGRVK